MNIKLEVGIGRNHAARPVRAIAVVLCEVTKGMAREVKGLAGVVICCCCCCCLCASVFVCSRLVIYIMVSIRSVCLDLLSCARAHVCA